MSHKFASHINAAVKAGILNGYQNGKFGPYDYATRGQFTVFLYKALPSPKAPLVTLSSPIVTRST